MLVRHACAEDSAALQRLYDEHFAFVHSADRRIRRRTQIAWIGREAGVVWVGEVKGRIGGYVSAWQRDDAEWGHVLWIDHMALDAHEAFPGLGRELVNAARAEATGQGCRWLVAEVPRYNPIEQAFWTALGAQRTNRRGAPGYDVMRLAI